MCKINQLILCILICKFMNSIVSSPIKDTDDQINRNLISEAIKKFYGSFHMAKLMDKSNDLDNHAFSPLSISHIFSMMISSAGNETKTELMNVLGYTNKDLMVERVNHGYRSLLDLYDENKLNKNKRKIKLKMANVALYNSCLEIKNDFEKNLKNYYKVDPLQIDAERPKSLYKINNYVKENTNGLITDLFEDYDMDSKFALGSAFAFKGQFEKELSILKNLTFTNADNSTNQVKMMCQSHSYRYLETNEEQIVEIPYLDDVTMIIFLPHENMTFGTPTSKCSYIEKIHNYLSPNNTTPPVEELIEVCLPEFNIGHSIDLKKQLKQMGIVKLFDPNEADLSGISDLNFFVSQAVHKVHFNINPSGTSVCNKETYMNEPYTQVNHKKLIIDRPFFFLVFDRLNDLPLISGVIKKL